MPHFFDETAVFVASGPDFGAELLDGRDYESALAELLREHGPERMNVYVQQDDGTLALLEQGTAMTGKDDLAKYYVTTYTSTATGLVAEVGWDT